jgi:hypothetical protein
MSEREQNAPASEPECTGPFSDARTCPVHSKDIYGAVPLNADPPTEWDRA